MNCRRAALTVALLAVLPWVGWAQTQAPNEVKAVRLAVHPAAEPMPLLKYTLLPSPADQTDGNAAILYERAAAMASATQTAGRDGVGELLGVPEDQMSVDKARQAISGYRDALREVELAAQRRVVEWDLPMSEGFGMLLPELSQLRNVARALALRVRIEAASGQTDAAVASLQSGFSLGRGVAHAPILINGLVGVAIANMMLDRVQELEQQPDAPNLYWALTALPRPLVSLREALEFESQLGFWKEALRHPAKAQLSAEGWRQVAVELGADMASNIATPRTGSESMWTTAAALATYTDAKKHLLATGYTPEQVEAMPVLQAVAIYMMDGYRRISDASYEWFCIPYWQARGHLDAASEELARASKEKNTILAAMLLPALGRAYTSEVQLDRRVDALRCVEAVRLYAAANDGRLPASLDDVKVVPIPLDPATDEPFGYKLEGATAVLSAPPADPKRPDTALRYEMTIAK